MGDGMISFVGGEEFSLRDKFPHICPLFWGGIVKKNYYRKVRALYCYAKW